MRRLSRSAVAFPARAVRAAAVVAVLVAGLTGCPAAYQSDDMKACREMCAPQLVASFEVERGCTCDQASRTIVRVGADGGAR